MLCLDFLDPFMDQAMSMSGVMAQFSTNANIRNAMLAGLPPSELGQIRPSLGPVWLEAEEPLLDVAEAPQFVYFPESSIISVATWAEGDRHTLIGIYGYEGCGSIAAVLDAPTSPNTETVQFPGYANRMPVPHLRKLLDACPGFRRRLLHFVHIFTMQVAYTAVANSHNRVEQRLARWLLMYQDRVRRSSLVITHQRLSHILGVRRSGVTEAIHLLEGRRFIRAQRGVIDILDRPSLEALTGGCYGRPEAEHRRLI